MAVQTKNEMIEQTALSHGFDRVYFLSPKVPANWRSAAQKANVGERLTSDIHADCERAECVVVLVRSYMPFLPEERISAYYLNSQRGYISCKAVMAELNSAGVWCEEARVPVRAMLVDNGIGAVGKNALLRIDPYGSRISLHAFYTDAAMPCTYSVWSKPCGLDCTACENACPMGAIDNDGFHAQRCMRWRDDEGENRLRFVEHKRHYSGCEICMHACPMNATIEPSMPDAYMKSAFDPERLVRGELKAAKAYYGKNINKGGRLIADAVIFAARDGRCRDAVASLCTDSPYEAVRVSAREAFKKYFIER